MIIVYTSRLNNTHRLVERVASKITPRPKVLRIPWSVTPEDRPALHRALDHAAASGERVLLVTPTYQRYNESKLGLRYTPLAIEKFLLYRDGIFTSRVDGVVASGNRTFAGEFCMAGEELRTFLTVPLIAKVDMSGSDLDDEEIIRFVNENQLAEHNRRVIEEDKTAEPM